MKIVKCVIRCVVVFAMSRKCVNSPNLFFTSVVNLPNSRRQNPLPLQHRKRMNYILAVKLGIRARVGYYIHVTVDVRDNYVADSLALTNQCLSQSLWCGENRRIILRTATLV